MRRARDVGTLFGNDPRYDLRQPARLDAARLATRAKAPVFEVKAFAPIRDNPCTAAEWTATQLDIFQFQGPPW